MANIVIILGAGASRCVGAPLMYDFLDAAERLLTLNRVEEHRDDFKLVFRGLNALQQAHAKIQIEQDNLESAFAAFEMAKLLGELPGLKKEELDHLPDAMRTVIEITLINTVQGQVSETQKGNVLALSYYDNLLGELSARLQNPSDATIAFITFNYDLCIDYMLERLGQPFSYGFKSDFTKIKLLKLHGSLGWTKCPECEEITITRVSDALRIWLDSHCNGDFVTFAPIVANASKQCENHKRPRNLVLVPPTWSKAEHHSHIREVWQSAARELQGAEHIITCGYSLPESDHFFRYLLALSTIGPSRMKDFIVVDPDPQVEARCAGLLGPLAKRRFQFHQGRFAEFTGLFSDLLRRVRVQ